MTRVECAAGGSEEIFDSFFDRADVARPGCALESTTVDHDVTITGAGWHDNQEESPNPTRYMRILKPLAFSCLVVPDVFLSTRYWRSLLWSCAQPSFCSRLSSS